MSGHTGKGVGGHGIYEVGRLGLRHMTTPHPAPTTNCCRAGTDLGTER